MFQDIPKTNYKKFLEEKLKFPNKINRFNNRATRVSLEMGDDKCFVGIFLLLML